MYRHGPEAFDAARVAVTDLLVVGQRDEAMSVAIRYPRHFGDYFLIQQFALEQFAVKLIKVRGRGADVAGRADVGHAPPTCVLPAILHFAKGGRFAACRVNGAADVGVGQAGGFDDVVA